MNFFDPGKELGRSVSVAAGMAITGEARFRPKCKSFMVASLERNTSIPRGDYQRQHLYPNITMPAKIDSYQCAHCKKLLPVTGRYIEVIAMNVKEHAAEFDSQKRYQPKPEVSAVLATDVVVCDNDCLCNLATLKGY